MGLIRYFQRIRDRLQRGKPQFHVANADEMPEHLRGGLVYLVGSTQTPWAAVFGCPSGCGARIELNLRAEVSPFWRVVCHADNTISIWPSIHRKVGCRSHFWIERGYVVNVYDMPRPGRR